MVGSIDALRAGDLSLEDLVRNLRGQWEAAAIDDEALSFGFEAVWAPIDGEWELRSEPWSRPELVSEVRLEEALVKFRDWAAALCGDA